VVAARSGDVATVTQLARSGAKLDAPSGGNGWTPLLHAVHAGSAEGARALLEAGADPEATGSKGEVALVRAAAYGDTAMVRLLLDAGADAVARDKRWSRALDAALSGSLDPANFTFGSCQTETVALLIEHSPYLRDRDYRGGIGRLVAYVRGCDEIQRLLNEGSVDPRAGW
jgi:hypothetical protein